MASPTDYPKRPKFFAMKFCRLVMKACVANELGPEAALLLMSVANTEDAKGYRGPVNYWNGQLAPLVGCRSETAFKRVREKCQRAGWLAYSPGSRSKPPVYYVTIPPAVAGWDDAPTDDSPADFIQTETIHTPKIGLNADGMRTECGRNADSIRPTSFPVPVPIPEDPLPPESAEPPTDKPPRPDDVIAAWNAVPGLPAFKGTNPHFRRLIAERWRDQRFRDRWRDVFAALGRSEWHTGRAGGDDAFVATLSWALDGRGWEKAFAVLERHDAKPPPPPSIGRSAMMDYVGDLDVMTAQSIRDRMAAHRGGSSHGF